MTRTRRIAATVVIVATTTVGAAGVANASESHRGNDRYGHCSYNDYDRYGNRNRYDNDRNRYDNDRNRNRCDNERGLIGGVLHLLDNIL
jgi:hypothetical protein